MNPFRPSAFAAEHRLFRSLRKWLLWREEDRVLIAPPNRVYKLNATGSTVWRWLEAGGRLDDIPGMDESRARDVRDFFRDLALMTGGKKVDAERVPYDFSYTRLPVLAEIAITYRCGNRCRFCYAGCGPCQAPAEDARREMDTREVKRVIDIFARDAKVPFFSFTGGEPTLRSDLEELCAYATKAGLRINLVTNGTLVDKARAKALRKAGLRTAQASLESPDRAIHDSLCGLEGAFDRTIRGIEALRSEGIRVQTNSTITTENAESLERMPEFSRSLGTVRLSMNLFIPTRKSPEAAALFVPYSDVAPIVDRVTKAAREARIEFLWYSPTPYCVFNPVARGLGNKNCAAVDGLLHVNPYGDVLPCSSWDEPIGNVLAAPFREIWFSERAAWFKNKRFAPEPCGGCDSFVACQGACPLYFAWRDAGELVPRRAAATEGRREPALAGARQGAKE